MTEAKKPTVLFVDDDEASTRALLRKLAQEKPAFEAVSATSAEQALELAKTEEPACAVVDLTLDEAEGPDSGLSLITELLTLSPSLRIIVLTGQNAQEYGVKSLNHGAGTFLNKPPKVPHLLSLIEDAISVYQLHANYLALAAEKLPAANVLGLKTESAAMVSVVKAIEFAASNSQPVLITGETGTGKGVSAKAIHALSAVDGPFVRYQPTYSSPDLVASELFGHKKGAFTGATEHRKGLINEAHNGTLFIDEVAELPKETQVLLLDVLQEKKYRPIGENTELYSSFRLVAATNVGPEELKEKLREDFYHRIAAMSIELPPLRARKEDIAALARDFAQDIAERDGLPVFGISPAAFAYLSSNQWPGNIRELEHAVGNAVHRAAFEERSIIEAADLEPFKAEAPEESLTLGERVHQFELQLVKRMLEECGGNQSEVARKLLVNRNTIMRILKRNS